MSVDADDLIEKFPEFAQAEAGVAGAAMITAAIAEATLEIDVAVWGDLADVGTLWLAAHILCISPYGKNSRLMAKDGTTRYGNRHKELVKITSSGFRVA